uniref:Uncharacterized protein n=1 Tax=Tetradesmus obliquus TaxID=3088 RepID=A0A383W2K4_TETOB|eukprot:jgi/Sobl393_1/15579/SZX71711.1
MEGCLADAVGQPWQSLPFIDASGTLLLDCIKRQPALTQFGAPQAGWSAAACNVAGYQFKERQLPTEHGASVYWHTEHDQRVQLYTLQPPGTSSKTPFPLATQAATAAACDALDACVMFESDGFLIGAYRPVNDVAALPKMLEAEKQKGPWQWRTMRYCSGKCCGTWMSTGFDAASLAALPSQVQPGGSTGALTTISLPGGSPEPDASPAYAVNPSSKRCAALRAGDISSFTCPARCRVACCAQDDAEGGLIELSEHRFQQCSIQACKRSCGFQLTTVPAVSGPFSPQVVALYLAQKSRGKPGTAAGTRKSDGSGGCTGSLC